MNDLIKILEAAQMWLNDEMDAPVMEDWSEDEVARLYGKVTHSLNNESGGHPMVQWIIDIAKEMQS